MSGSERRGVGRGVDSSIGVNRDPCQEPRRSSIPPSRRHGSFDELRDPTGEIRPHQRPLADFGAGKSILARAALVLSHVPLA